MKDYLRDLGHARNGSDGEVAETIDGPGVLVSLYETAAIWRISKNVQSKLSICFHRVDARREEKAWSLLLAAKNVREV